MMIGTDLSSSSIPTYPLSWKYKLRHDMLQVTSISDIRQQSNIYNDLDIEKQYECVDETPDSNIVFDTHCDVSTLNYNIDFVENFDGNEIYVMYDDIFWHGLTRDINEISQSKDDVDQLIYEVIKRDFLFNTWCEENNKNLVRFVVQNYHAFIDGDDQELQYFYGCGDKKLISKYIKYINKSRNKKIKLELA